MAETTELKKSDFYFDLPQELIAQDPLEDRSSSRLLVLDKNTGEISHHIFRDIIDYLHPGDCLVLNNTKVIPARLLGEREGTGGHVEVLLLKRKEADVWETLVKPGKKCKPGQRLSFGDGLLKAEVLPRNEDHLYDVRQKVGMVFQNPDNQIVATIVEEDVAFAPENLGVPPEEIRTRIDEAMKLAGIYEKRDAAPYKLSGGQKQRVAIAGVIAMRPDCLVLDESTAMLDPHGRAQVMKTIHQLRAAGITIVSITHYMEEAAQADRVLVMSRGRIVMEGTPEQVFSQTEKLHSYHLDVPQAAELRDELVKAGIPMPENVITPEACAEELFKLLK